MTTLTRARHERVFDILALYTQNVHVVSTISYFLEGPHLEPNFEVLKGRGPGINSSQSKNVGKIQLSIQLSHLSIIFENIWF